METITTAATLDSVNLQQLARRWGWAQQRSVKVLVDVLLDPISVGEVVLRRDGVSARFLASGVDLVEQIVQLLAPGACAGVLPDSDLAVVEVGAVGAWPRDVGMSIREICRALHLGQW